MSSSGIFQPQDLNVLAASPTRVKTEGSGGPLAREQTESGVILIQLIGMIACYPGLLGLIWQAWGLAGARSSKMGVTESKMGVRETHESVTNAHQGDQGCQHRPDNKTAGGVSRCRATGGKRTRASRTSLKPLGALGSPGEPLPLPHGWRGLRRRRAPGFYVQAVNFDTSSRSRCRALSLHRAIPIDAVRIVGMSQAGTRLYMLSKSSFFLFGPNRFWGRGACRCLVGPPGLPISGGQLSNTTAQQQHRPARYCVQRATEPTIIGMRLDE